MKENSAIKENVVVIGVSAVIVLLVLGVSFSLMKRVQKPALQPTVVIAPEMMDAYLQKIHPEAAAESQILQDQELAYVSKFHEHLIWLLREDKVDEAVGELKNNNLFYQKFLKKGVLEDALIAHQAITRNATFLADKIDIFGAAVLAHDDLVNSFDTPSAQEILEANGGSNEAALAELQKSEKEREEAFRILKEAH